MAQKFLPSHRKWLDYEAVINREGFLFPLLIIFAHVSAPVEYAGAFFVVKNRDF